MEEEPIDTSDPKQIKARKTKQQLVREKELAELTEILHTYSGRAFLWRLLLECKVGHFGLPKDELERTEGKRIIGGWVIEEVEEADPGAYARMRDEAVSRDTMEKG